MADERILVVEDDGDMRDALGDLLEEAGYRVVLAPDGAAALRHVDGGEEIDLVVTDVRMPGLSGAEILASVRARRAEVHVIVITAFGSVEQAIEMVKAGAFTYLPKPVAASDFLDAVRNALETSAPQRERERLRRRTPTAAARIVGASRPMRELFELMERAARSNSTVLVTGESGTGKELVAKAVHEASERPGLFVPVNCAAIPAELIESELFGHTGGAFTGAKHQRAGLFEAANGGTLFLDEVGEMPLAVQPKVLRALQEGMVRRVGAERERPVDVRLIAATNRDLEAEVREGRFREDLFWRLNVIHLSVPPLRERVADIALLAEHFMAKASASAGRPPLDIPAETLAILTSYSWPGNVRELENAVERAVALAQGAFLEPEDLPERIRSSGSVAALVARSGERKLTLRELEREYIVETLRRTGGNKSRAAEILGLDRTTLYRRLEEYGRDDGST
jgi:DNA-binding NtrC family response regulator